MVNTQEAYEFVERTLAEQGCYAKYEDGGTRLIDAMTVLRHAIPRRFVVERESHGKWSVRRHRGPNSFAYALEIPTEEAAQKIADIYEAATE